jgi:hypothetical protein
MKSLIGLAEIFGGFDRAPKLGALEACHAPLLGEFRKGGRLVVSFRRKAGEHCGIYEVDARVDPIGERGLLREAVHPTGILDAYYAVGTDQLREQDSHERSGRVV